MLKNFEAYKKAEKKDDFCESKHKIYLNKNDMNFVQE